MSGTLGTGYVAVTPVNLSVPPRELEGSKAGLLVLNWAQVKAVNHTYNQPINLLQLYQTGQFTTVQSVLIDNSNVNYPVRLVSQSTGQRVLCPANAQVMSPLLVSAAPLLTVGLILPPGVTQALDQTNTQIFFLNTPQAPFQIQGQGNPSLGSYSQTATVNFPAAPAGPGNSVGNVVTLIPAFAPGSQAIGYTSLSIAVAAPPTFLDNVNGQAMVPDITLQLLDGAAVLWQDARVWPNVAANQGQLLPYTVSQTFPPGLINTDGGATTIHTILGLDNGLLAGGSTALTINFFYTITVPS